MVSLRGDLFGQWEKEFPEYGHDPMRGQTSCRGLEYPGRGPDLSPQKFYINVQNQSRGKGEVWDPEVNGESRTPVVFFRRVTVAPVDFASRFFVKLGVGMVTVQRGKGGGDGLSTALPNWNENATSTGSETKKTRDAI